MKTHSAIATVLLCFCLILLCVTGCGTPASDPLPTQLQIPSSIPSTDPPVDPPVDPTEPVTIPLHDQLVQADPQTLEDWVFTAFNQTFAWRDDVGNFCSVTLTLPAITPVTEFAAEYNRMVHDMGTRLLEDVNDCREQGYSNTVRSLTYEAHLSGHILSVVLIEQSVTDSTYYLASSFDLDTMQPLTTAQLSQELLNLSYPAFILATNAIIEQEFVYQFGHLAPDEDEPGVNSDGFPVHEPSPEQELYQQLLEDIPTNTANILQRNLYVGENGQLMLIFDAPSLAGAAYYPTAIPFDLDAVGLESLPSEEYAYNRLFSLMDQTDGAYTDAYCSILRQAFLADSSGFIQHSASLPPNRQESVLIFLAHTGDAETLTARCQEILSQENSSHAEAAFATRLLELLDQ